MVTAIITAICILNLIFVFLFLRDLIANRKEAMQEPGNPIVMAFSQAIIYFFSTFGISDFAIGISLYPRMKWVSTKKLPGTLNTCCVIPVAVMALAYISTIEISALTLLVPIVCQVIGSYVSPKLVVKLPARIIKILVTIGLIVAAIVILLNQFNVYANSGTAKELSVGGLIILGIASFIFGALNNMGIGSYALTMATVFLLGLDIKAAFPIMMGSCALSVPVGSMQFIRLKSYARKLTFFSAITGVIGVLCAVFLVTEMPVNILQWIVLAVIVYSAIMMILSLRKPEEVEESTPNAA